MTSSGSRRIKRMPRIAGGAWITSVPTAGEPVPNGEIRTCYTSSAVSRSCSW
jgi:hypothetical protein